MDIDLSDLDETIKRAVYLPGLLLAREIIDQHIAGIKAKPAGTTTAQVTVKSVKPLTFKAAESTPPRSNRGGWANKTPEQRAKWMAAVAAGKKRAARKRKLGR